MDKVLDKTKSPVVMATIVWDYLESWGYTTDDIKDVSEILSAWSDRLKQQGYDNY